jgi:hypothetical protein
VSSRASIACGARWHGWSGASSHHLRSSCFVAEHAPDVLVATHLAEWASPQGDYVHAASGLVSAPPSGSNSWDNLTNKGLVRDVPDRVLVWNDLQAAGAIELQGLPVERVRVTGAPAHDHWFTWTLSRDRENFCSEVGLRADRPIVL